MSSSCEQYLVVLPLLITAGITTNDDDDDDDGDGAKDVYGKMRHRKRREEEIGGAGNLYITFINSRVSFKFIMYTSFHA